MPGAGQGRRWAWALVLAAGCWSGLTSQGRAATAIGDAGHFVMGHPRMYLLNEDGGAFSITIHRFQWWIGAGWNRTDLDVKVTGPGTNVVFEQACTIPDGGYVVEVPAGRKGVYLLEVNSHGLLNYFYVTSDLSRSVAWTGDGSRPPYGSRALFFTPFAPRRWHFWVPEGTERFRITAVNSRGRSHREDHGLTLFSPRGQRMKVLWGQANQDAETELIGDEQRLLQREEVLVEAGTDGRFWSMEVRCGDSHTYSDIHFLLDGVPPYIARSPEEWFDPESGAPADVSAYDDDEFVQSDVSPDPARIVQHWTPAPAIGDPDACEIRCPARLAYWNPEGRELKFVIGTYLPRNMFPMNSGGSGKHLAEVEHDHATVTMKGRLWKTVLKERVPLKHLHGHHEGFARCISPRGVFTADIADAEHFWAYTYPAVPTVMVGSDAGDGWQRFMFEAGTGRNWFFLVPGGTQTFDVRVAVADETDVLHMEVNAPDRVMAVIYDNSGQRTVAVPEGLDGKIWHVRLDVGSATRILSSLPNPRFPSLNVTLDLKGVPGYLAPTWEQWFDPRRPRAACRR